jgi:hypothetical protein
MLIANQDCGCRNGVIMLNGCTDHLASSGLSFLLDSFEIGKRLPLGILNKTSVVGQ